MNAAHLIFFFFNAAGEAPEPEPEVAVSLPAGTGRATRRLRDQFFVANIDGVDRMFSSVAEMEEFISALAAEHERRLKRKYKKRIARIVATGKRVSEPMLPRIEVRNAPVEVSGQVAHANARFEAIFWQMVADAMDREGREDAEEREDIAWILMNEDV